LKIRKNRKFEFEFFPVNMNFERDYLIKMAEDDIASFDHLFMLYYPPVKKFILGLVKNEEDSRDLVQDIFLKIWLGRAKLTEIENFKGYLFRISKNAVFDFFRNNKSLESLEDEKSLPLSEEASTGEWMDARDLEVFVEICVEQMPEKRRLIYKMSREEGLTNGEIAEKLHISKRTVETHISNALKEIRKLIMIIFLFM